MQTLWEKKFSNQAQRMKSSVIREILKHSSAPNVISFAGGLPAPEVFPLEAFKEATQLIFEEAGAVSLQYSITEGFVPLRQMIADYSEQFGIQADLANIQITTGSQQALDFLGRLFISPGDKIVVESPTYLGALQAWDSYGVEYLTVPMDEQGMRTDLLEDVLKQDPKFIYVVPNFQNPSGVTMSLERRQHLVELADRYGVPIVEDDPYGKLRYRGEPISPVMVVDRKYRRITGKEYTGNVIYLSTFSKLLAPGIRVAWMIADKPVIAKIVQAKQAADLHTSSINQMVAYEVARDGFLDEYNKVIRETYAERLDVMLAALEEHFPPGVSWTRPEGGMFLWVVLPKGLDATELLPKAVELRVAFVPGGPFHPDGVGANTMRLNFSNASPENIHIGIARLGKLLEAELA
ncbi:MAG: PLP-dependent aminotransferase family protein [Chloroflexi bacterium]|jgi:2-aminoadipate transaminase|nr:PLP-dependent aminotransferase family protein [Chloroflexota bacterium]